MAISERREKDAPETSATSHTSSGRHGVTLTLGVPVRRLSELSEAWVPHQNAFRATWSRLWEADPPVLPLRLGPGAPWPKVRRFVPAFLTSTLLHSSLVFFLWSIPFAALLVWLTGRSPERTPSHPHEVVVEFQHLNLADYLPVIRPPGHGKAPGRGAKPGTHPRLGRTHFDPRITIISNPPHPDNFRFTLRTENAPPALKLPKDLKIPDFISGGPAPIPAAPKSPAPAPEKVETVTHEKPNVAPPPKPMEIPSVPLPKLTAPPPPPPPPVQLALRLPTIPDPQLEVPPPPPPVKNQSPPQPAPQGNTHPAAAASPAAAPNKSETGVPGDKQQSGGGPKIMALSVDPVPFKDLSQIPAGQHEGAFSVGPAGTGQGSPGGVPSGSPDVGEGGPGPGGDKSAAVGDGKGIPGGGGHDSSAYTSPTVSVSGQAGNAGISAGTLAPLKAEDLVYALKPDTPKTHAPSMVVSGSSYGGGGLRLYGVLHSDRVYTVYFSMPGKSWVLEYCVRDSARPVDSATRAVQINIQPPLIPPAAITEFDFHRPTEQPDPANSMIILHGIIHVDGSVSDLAVLQGRDAMSDAAACAAFSRWKFKPALRAGTPVELEILVGIP